jgi:hypothetical protein
MLRALMLGGIASLAIYTTAGANPPSYNTSSGPQSATGVCITHTNGTCDDTFAGGGGGGGGGGGPVTAVSGAYAAGSITDLGSGASPAQYTVNYNLNQIRMTLGSPFQAGGLIGNTAFGISGTLPGFASTPTFNLGTSPNLTFTNTGFNALQGGAANSASNPFYFGQATGSIFSVADTNLLAAVNGPTPPQTTKQVDIGAVEQTIAAPVASTAAEACHVLKASAGILYSVGGLAGQAEYFMLFNATSAPADGTVTPVWWGQAGAAGYWGVSFPNPLSLSTGVTVCASSTAPFTKTAISTGNVFSGQVQ